MTYANHIRKSFITVAFIGGILLFACHGTHTPIDNHKITCTVAIADSDYIFLSPDPIRFTVTIANDNEGRTPAVLTVTCTTDDYRFLHADTLPIILKGKQTYRREFRKENPDPGFYRYAVQLLRNDTTIFETKVNVGVEPEQISSPIDAKDDFKAFWENNLAELKKVAPKYKLTPQPQHSNADYRMFLVEMRSFENELIRGYYAQPTHAGKHPVIIEYMGYNTPGYLPDTTWDGFAHFVLSIRGQGLNQPTNRFGKWIMYGLESKETYYYRGAFLDVVRAVDFVCSRPEIDADRIGVQGGSQGGALSFAAAALDPRVKAASPHIPFLSDYRDYFKIAAWPKNDLDEYVSKHPETSLEKIYDVLSYFDVKNLAQWITCPVIMGIGVQDEICPPHTNFAVFNQVKSRKTWVAYPTLGHTHEVGSAYHGETMKMFAEMK
ncbi:MAG: acetylxylan esterase [Prevotellaceae bacterium]|jgi:cephalosporin-C deacetylase-like acetyl esterase|nr:acetylxylan esterase [Prevotellaceae bacterium]